MFGSPLPYDDLAAMQGGLFAKLQFASLKRSVPKLPPFRENYLMEQALALKAGLGTSAMKLAYLGGVPGRIRYDNLKPAVIRVLKGRDRTESERFTALRSHYGFDSFFCRPGIDGAHEKGGVEGEIGRFRRRHLVPVPTVASLAELNDLIADAE